MRQVLMRPDAGAMIQSLRSIGYGFATALADVIDNSISANASEIAIRFGGSTAPYIAIIDDGHGMGELELIEAMRHGGKGPLGDRSPNDLGRYGLGLKTASLSQCRKLTVASLKNGQLCGARWDLDEVESHNDWLLTILGANDVRSLPHFDKLEKSSAGTIVVWEEFDRLSPGSRAKLDSISQLVDDSRDRLGLIFHRFRNTENGSRKVSISTNGLALEEFDPFILSNRRTESLQREVVGVGLSSVVIQPYILPHISKITLNQMRLSGGQERLRESQGCYVYRNRRLIVAGSWFRLAKSEELTKLARVQIDIGNATDDDWSLDIKKSSAVPPLVVKAVLRRLVDRIANRSANVFRNRKQRITENDIVRVWQRLPERNGVFYKINRSHPSIESLTAELADDELALLERVLRSIELALPTDAIYADIAANDPVSRTDEQVFDELRAMASSMVERLNNDEAARKMLLSALPKIEPFAMHVAATRKIIEELA